QRLGEDRVIRAPDAVAVDLQDRDRARPRAGRDDDVLRLDHPLLALPRGLLVTVAGVRAGIDLDLAVAQQAAPPLDVLDLVLLEQERDAPRTLLRDLAGALPGRADVELHVADRDAEIAQPARDVPRVVGRLEHRLGRDAPPVVADAAELLRLDARHLHPALRRPDRGHVAARPAAERDHIEGVLRHASPRGSSCCTALSSAALPDGLRPCAGTGAQVIACAARGQ